MTAEIANALGRAIDPDRLAKTALALLEVPSPTCQAGEVADRLAEILHQAGFAVERPVADWPKAPAVVARLAGDRPGRLLQFDGHLDTVPLPFVQPRLENGYLYGSGAADMKGGIAAAVEALQVLRETGALKAGGVLLTAHDHHEAPWGDKRQLKALIREGYRGDGVLIPEYLADCLPLVGRGLAIFAVHIRRQGEPIHEVLADPAMPDVLGAGAELVLRFQDLNRRLNRLSVSPGKGDSIFVGHLQSGELYNQWPTECLLEGTRRWVEPGAGEAAKAEFDRLVAELARDTRTQIETEFEVCAEAFCLDPADPLVAAFQQAHQAATGKRLPEGEKPFVDDGNWFAAQAGIPAITHGPAATGAHSQQECVSIAELQRVAWIYALTAINYGGTRAREGKP